MKERSLRYICVFIDTIPVEQNPTTSLRMRRDGDPVCYRHNSLTVLAAACGSFISRGALFRAKGKHAVIFYDDLSKQAVAYRQMKATR